MNRQVGAYGPEAQLRRSGTIVIGIVIGSALALLLGLSALSAASATPAEAPSAHRQGTDSSAPDATPRGSYVILRADEFIYDERTGDATAIGHVEIAQGDRILLADRVDYNEARDSFSASGNVSLLEADGTVYFGDTGQFVNQFRDGFITGFRMLMTDNSRLAANESRRTSGVINRLTRAIYSPCDLCEDNPERAPLWQIRAVEVIHDSERQLVEYSDAWLEIFGVPVAYTPYFSHPDPTVTRRSGFLAPSYRSDSRFGQSLVTPYFWAIDDSRDLTLTPFFNSDDGSVLAGDYRQRFNQGDLSISGSLTRADRRRGAVKTGGKEARGHLFIQGRQDLDEIWRARYQLQRASDGTYLRVYGFDHPQNSRLETSATLEGFHGHNYSRISAFHFQGLRETDQSSRTPLILPFAEYNYVSRPQPGGAYYTADASLLGLHRRDGADSRRAALKTGWHLPYTAPTGEIYEMGVMLNSDLYWVDDVESGNSTVSGVTGRLFPQAMFRMRYPLIRREAGSTQSLEPMAAVIVSPNGGNTSRIPNEDSRDLEFDDTNLFSPNRNTGVDRVDGGQRFIYGVNWGLHGDQGGSVNAFLGQSYRLQSNSSFVRGSGLEKQLSDIVGRVQVRPHDALDFLYRFRFDPSGFRAQRNEVQGWARQGWLTVGVNYFFVSEEAGTGEFNDREEITVSLGAALTRHWSAHAHFRENLARNGGRISQGLGLRYSDECLIFTANFDRVFTEDRDLRPTDTLWLQLTFKHLGEFGFSR